MKVLGITVERALLERWRDWLMPAEHPYVVPRRIESGRRPSQHAAVPAEVWENCVARLPGARQIAGAFPAASGPNCFGTVMGAAGVAGAATSWVQPAAFGSWLDEATMPIRTRERDHVAGTVLVWREADGALAHAAVTLGGGWLLQKWSQGWMTPVSVEALRDGMMAARARGQRVTRRTVRRPRTA